MLLAVVLALAGAAQAEGPRGSGSIYKCTDANGKPHTSDRPIPECSGRPHESLNADGSVKAVIPPPLTADERSEQEARERREDAERVGRMDAERRDKNLVQRYPNAAEHAKARAKALDDVRKQVANSEARLALLNAERKPLLDEAEFYVGKPLPNKLKLALDANDAALEAQKSLAQNQKAEDVRINAVYDAELSRLRKLWNGAKPGTLGPMPSSAAAAASPGSRSAKL